MSVSDWISIICAGVALIVTVIIAVLQIRQSNRKMIGRSLNADLRKMKGTSVILAHLLIPIITSVIFLIYYFFSPWNENMKVIAFYQAIGAGLPVLIGIFTASVMEQEQNAGDFQNLLSLPDKPAAFEN